MYVYVCVVNVNVNEVFYNDQGELTIHLWLIELYEKQKACNNSYCCRLYIFPVLFYQR